MRRLMPLAFLLAAGCSTIDATADPQTGRITAFHYKGYFRQYDASLVDSPDGTRTIIIGARSEIDKVTEFLKVLGAGGGGALMGAAAPAFRAIQ